MNSLRSTPNRHAFTLIELLIVVGVISILAAIALPNFLEAQVRSKVARVRADMRTVATALEAYAVDYNAFPPARSFFDPLPSARLRPLTTPVAYITSIPHDPFERRTGSNYEDSIRAIDPSEPLDMYVYNLATNQFGLGGDTNRARSMAWSMASGGPDTVLEFPYYAFSDTFVQTNIYLTYIYDPTNGTISRGEIFRRGGGSLRPIPGLDN